jgi:hypothetical protein
MKRHPPWLILTIHCQEIDLPEVKNAAARHIEASLTPDNVMSEIFSNFSSEYDDIYKLELEYVKQHWVCGLYLLAVDF